MCNRSDTIKDDYDRATKIGYIILFFMYLITMGLTLISGYFARQKLHNKAMLSLYVSAFAVLFLRIILFMDPLMNYCMETYVVLLISLPTYYYIVTGLSIFLMLLESILKYKNLLTNENIDLSPEERLRRIEKKLKMIDLIHWVPVILMVIITIYFTVREICCAINKCSEDYEAHAFVAYEPIIVCNFINFLLLATVAILFIRELNLRYGQSYSRAKNTVATYMTLFSLSYLIRGTDDIFLLIPLNFKALHSATWLVLFYFLTEVLPMCVIFSVHIS